MCREGSPWRAAQTLGRFSRGIHSHAANSASGSGSSKSSPITSFGSCPKIRGRGCTGVRTATGRPWVVIVTGEPVRSTSAKMALSWALASVLEMVFTAPQYVNRTYRTSLYSLSLRKAARADSGANAGY